MHRRLPVILALVVLVLPTGCVFGGDMTAEKLEQKLADEHGGDHSWGNSTDDYECRESAPWDFICTDRHHTNTFDSEHQMAFVYEGSEVTCGTGSMSDDKALPPPLRFCEDA